MRRLAALVFAAGILVLLYIGAHGVDAGRNLDMVTRLLELKQLEAALNQDVLRARNNLIQDYQHIDATLAREDKLLEELRSMCDASSQAWNGNLEDQLDSFAKLHGARARVVESFENSNRVLMALIDRFPERASALEAKLRLVGAGDDMLQFVDRLEDQAFLYIGVGRVSARDALDGWLSTLELNAVGTPAESAPELSSVISLGSALSVYRSDLDNLIDRLFYLDAGRAIDELHLDYVAAYQSAQSSADDYRRLMFAFGGMMLCYIAYILLRLRRSITAVDAANRRLRDQTHALEESNRGLEREVEERRRAETDLMRAKEMAEYANRAKTEFLANMSHELRTPLNAIIGFSQIIRDQMMGAVPPHYIDYAKDILESGEHLLQVINDILDISKIEAGKAELEEGEVEIQRLVDACATLVEGRLGKAALTLDTKLQPDLPRLWADERKLKQIFINLLSNAVKFTPAGGRISVLATLRDDGGLSLAVADTGIGMTPDGIALALEPFKQVESSLSRKYEGTGLGLPLTRRLAEMHHAKLAIESEFGRGTTVSIQFPKDRVIAAEPTEGLTSESESAAA
jgi:signal transduction histidine kinase